MRGTKTHDFCSWKHCKGWRRLLSVSFPCIYQVPGLSSIALSSIPAQLGVTLRTDFLQSSCFSIPGAPPWLGGATFPCGKPPRWVVPVLLFATLFLTFKSAECLQTLLESVGAPGTQQSWKSDCTDLDGKTLKRRCLKWKASAEYI